MSVMIPKDTFDEEDSSSSVCTSGSSDSYSYLLRDTENPSNNVREEWEAIERTLYQESGKHVTDPLLLKECKLWRETFPQLRVRGTAVDTDGYKNGEHEDKNNVQTGNADQLLLSQINEKNEKIKKAVVSQIVDRLVRKLNLNRENSESNADIKDNTAEIENKIESKLILHTRASESRAKRESYFERGKEDNAFCKPQAKSTSVRMNSLSELFDRFGYNFEVERKTNLCTGTKDGKTFYRVNDCHQNLERNKEIFRSGNLGLKMAEKTGPKPKKLTDSSSSLTKHFEMPQKIDKKYKAMLGKILENDGISSRGRDERYIKPEIYSDSLQRLKPDGSREEYTAKKNRQLPKLDNFSNNWMYRAEKNMRGHYGISESICQGLYGVDRCDVYDNVRGVRKRCRSQTCRSACHLFQEDESFHEELKTDILNRRTFGHWIHEEEINFTRPQLNHKCHQRNTAKTQKSSSCGDLLKKNQRDFTRTSKSSLEKRKGESASNNGAKKKTGKKAGKNVLLPPIETSIICTEIARKPKATTKKYT